MNDVFTWPVGRAGESSRQVNPPALPVFAYVVAATAAGSLTGAGISALGITVRGGTQASSTVLLLAATLISIYAVTQQLQGKFWPLPQKSTQVPRRWLAWVSKPRTALAFGLIIGTGVLTRQQYAVTYVLGAVCLLSPSITSGAVLGCIYGAMRGIVLASTWFVDRFMNKRVQWPSLLDIYGRFVGVLLSGVAVGTFLATLIVAG